MSDFFEMRELSFGQSTMRGCLRETHPNFTLLISLIDSDEPRDFCHQVHHACDHVEFTSAEFACEMILALGGGGKAGNAG